MVYSSDTAPNADWLVGADVIVLGAAGKPTQRKINL